MSAIEVAVVGAGKMGGAIVRNRTFVFADYEGRRVREGITRITNVPTGLERIGSAEAKRVLDDLTNGTADALLTAEAKAALKRLPK